MYRSSTMGRWGGSILILVGLLQLALGAGFVLALGGLPYAGGGMMLTGGILFVVGVGLIIAGVIWLRRSADKDRISTTGLAGTGQITGLTQTGMMVNNQPVVKIEMLITVPGRQPYPASVREVVPLILLGSLGQGALPVRVDPARPDKIVVQWDQVGVGSAPFSQAAPLAPNDETLGQVAAALPAAAGAAPVFAQPGQAGVSIDQLRAQLRATGLSGVARIDVLQDSGQTVGNERLFTMTTTIFIPERIPYTSGPSAAMVPLEKVPRIAAGVELPVKVAPDNPGLVMFEWDRI